MSNLPARDDYAAWLVDLKSRMQRARSQAALAMNQELIRLYDHLGTEILERQQRQGWGAKVIERLATDLGESFPDMKGLSSRNLKYMKVFEVVLLNSHRFTARIVFRHLANEVTHGHLADSIEERMLTIIDAPLFLDHVEAPFESEGRRTIPSIGLG
jgi:hypothetical protein